MRTEMRIERMRPLIIGHEMDNLTGLVEIDCAAWMTAYPELTRYTLAVTPPDGTPYFVPTEMEGTILRWIVRREDTANAGEGSYQIIGTGNNGEQKSTDYYPLYIYGNMPGLDGASETPPEAALAWVSKVLDAADRAEEAAERAEGAAAGSVPVATQDKVGVVKPGEGLEVEKDGTLNVVGGGGGAVNSVNGKTGAVELDAADVGARPDTWKPTPEEIGAQPAGNYALKDEIPSVPVQSVNGKTGAVQLAAADVGALPANTQIPAPYTLPTASETVKGGVKVGKGLAMEGESLNAEVEKADIDKLSEEIVDQGKTIEELSEELANKGNPTAEQIGAAVNAYLDEHPVAPAEIDATLTQEGKAADAKAVGDAFAFETIIGTNILDMSNVSPNKNLIVSTGTVIDSNTSALSDYIYLSAGTTISLWSKYGKNEHVQNRFGRLCAYDDDDNRVDGVQNVLTYTMPENAVKIRASFGMEQLQDVSKPMIVIGVPDSVTYEPYNAQKVSNIKVLLENVLGLADMQEEVKKQNYNFRKVDAVCDAYECMAASIDEDTYGYKIEETYGLYDALVTAYPEYVSKSLLGSVAYDEDGETKTLPIYRYDFTPKLPINSQMPRLFKVLYCSGIHGIEATPIFIGARFFADLCANWRTQDLLRTLRFNCQFTVIPISNPYGYIKKIRHNENLVDLNRNFTRDWKNSGNLQQGDNNYPGPYAGSETSTQLIEAMIEGEPFDFGLDHHTYDTYANSDKAGYLVGCSKRPEDSRYINMMGVWLNAKTVKDNTLITDFTKSHFQTLGDQTDFNGYMYGAFPNGICFENMSRWDYASEAMEEVYESQKFSAETIGAIFYSAFVGYHTY